MEKEKLVEVASEITQEQFEKVVKENEELKKQMENLIKRYKKLSALYNEALERFLAD
jgi:putative methionine-R-sulfoxide reductase with GAF domain